MNFRHDPLPACVVSRGQRPRVCRFDGGAVRALTLGEQRGPMPQ